MICAPTDDGGQKADLEHLELCMVQRGFNLQWVWAVWRWLKKETFFSLLGLMNCQRQGSDGTVEKLCFLQQATNLFQFAPQ